MNFKSGKLYTTIREFDKKDGKYEINGIEDSSAVFLYKEPEKPFIPIPKGNYKITTEHNNRYINIDNEIEQKAERYQIIIANDLKSSKYEADFPELEVLQEKVNLIVDDLENIISFLKKTGVKTDELSMQQILPKLEPNTLWVSNELGEIDYIPYGDLNRKFDDMLELLKKATEETLENKKQQVLSDVEKEKIKQIEAFAEVITTKIEQTETYLGTHMNQKEQEYNGVFEEKLEEIIELKSRLEKEIRELKEQTTSTLKEEKQQAISQMEQKKETAIKEVSSVVSAYFQEHSDELKGPQGERGPKGTKGDRGLTGPQGERGVGVTSVTSLNNNQVRLNYGDGQSAVVEIPTVTGPRGQKGDNGKSLEFNWRDTQLGVRKEGDYYYDYIDLRGAMGVGIDTITQSQEDDTVTLNFNLSNNTSKSVNFTVPERTVDLSNYYNREETDRKFLTKKDGNQYLTLATLGPQLINFVVTQDLQNYAKTSEDASFEKNLNVKGEIFCSGDITAFSDIRLKENLSPIENALEKVNKLNGFTFDMKVAGKKRKTGLIAQEVLEVLPEAVSQSECGYYSIAYGNLVGLLVEAIKELQKEVEVMKRGD